MLTAALLTVELSQCSSVWTLDGTPVLLATSNANRLRPSVVPCIERKQTYRVDVNKSRLISIAISTS